MAQTFNIPNTGLVVGSQTFGPFAVVAGVSKVEFHTNPRVLFNNTGGFQLLSDMWIDIATDPGGADWRQMFGTGIFSDPNFTDGKTGSTSDCFTRFAVIPSPCQLRIRTDSKVAYTLTGAFIVVN